MNSELPDAHSPRLMPESWERLSVRDVLTVLFKYKALVAGVFVATVLGTLIVLWIRPQNYEVETRILIKYGKDISANPRSSLAPTANRMVSPSRPDINSEAEMIRSYALIEKVVRDLRLDRPEPPVPPTDFISRARFALRHTTDQLSGAVDEVQYRLALKERLNPKDRAIMEILNSLKVEGVKDSSVIDIKLQTKFRKGSSVILNHLVEAYREARLGIERTPEVEKFFTEEAARYRDKLQNSESKLNSLKSQAQSESLPDQIGFQTRLITETERALDETSNRLAEGRAQLSLLEKQVANEKPTAMVEQVQSRNALLDDLNNKRATLLLRRQEVLAKYTDDDVHVQDVDKEIATVDTMISNADQEVQKSRTTGENAVYVDLRKQWANALRQRDALEARSGTERAALAAYKDKLRALQMLAPEYSQLSRDVELNSESYKLYERNATEAKASAALNAEGITNIAFMDPAVDPILPTGIRRVYVFLGAVIGGLLLGFGLAFLTEALGHTVARPDQMARHFEFPVLATLPFVLRKRNVERLHALSIEGAANLAQHWKVLPGAGRDKSVLFLGANARAGTSTVARRLADAFQSEFRERVLLVSVCSGVPRQYSSRLLLPASNSGRDLTRPEALLEAGDSNGHNDSVQEGYFPAHLSSDQISTHIRNLEVKLPQFDRILIDVSSRLPLDKQVAVARACHGVVVVVEAEKTRYEVLEWMQQEFRRTRIPVLGAVLNKRRYHIPNFVYRWI